LGQSCISLLFIGVLSSERERAAHPIRE